MARVLETRKREHPPTPTDPGRVLVVERDKALRSSFVRSLGRRGMHVDTASTRAEAMALLQQHNYPVIVADPLLSTRAGVSLVEELRSVRPDASFILTTDGDTLSGAPAADGCTSVLRKPWNERQLRTAVDNANASYRVRQQSSSPSGTLDPNAPAILLIDEDSASTERLLSMLQRSAVARELQHCASARDALALLRARQFDAILLNDQGSAAAHLEALEQLRAAAPSAAVIALGDRIHEGSRALRARKSARAKDDTQTLRRIVLSGIERKQKGADLDFLSQVDPLTQLLSQAAFGERLEACVSSCRRAKTRCCVMLLNLAKFSDLNRQHGHEAGDTVLSEIGRRVQASVREDDAVARLSADEYAVLLTQVDEPSICTRVAERILGIVHVGVLLRDDLEVQLRAHVGIAIYPDTCQSSDSLMRHAHDALQDAKKERFDYVVHARPAATPSRTA